MNITIDDFKITSDQNNFIINEVKFYGEESKNYGLSYDKPIKYSHSFEGALKIVRDLLTRKSTATSVSEQIDYIQDLDLRFEKILANEKDGCHD